MDALALPDGTRQVLEIGPGMGVLTQYLLRRSDLTLHVVEIDRESVAYLEAMYPPLADRILNADFLRLDLGQELPGSLAIIGNFPYNISSQIFFQVLEFRQQVTEVVGMLQLEVAERLAAPPGSRTYGILSVLLQAYYSVELLFKVGPEVFSPPPKVDSAVVRLVRNDVAALACDERLFVRVVKQAFSTRRKTLRNALKPLGLPLEITAQPLFDRRAETLGVAEFVYLTQQAAAAALSR